MHEIMEHDIQEGRSQAWHGLTKVKEDLTIQNCWLSTWDYVGHRLVANGKELPLCVLGTTDEPDLFIGDSYNPKSFKPILNKGLLERVDKAIEGKGLTLESDGTIKNRGRQFLSFSMDAALFQAGGRPFKSFLNLGNGNDQSSPLWVNTSNICTVCNNTFGMNLAEAGMIMKVKKTQFSEFKLDQMGVAIETMLTGQAMFKERFDYLAGRPCDEQTAREFFASFVCTGDKLSTNALNSIERLLQLFKGGAGNDGNDFSDVFSAITDYCTHENASGKDDQEARWKNHLSSEYGKGKQQKEVAWNLLIDSKKRKAAIEFGKALLKGEVTKA